MVDAENTPSPGAWIGGVVIGVVTFALVLAAAQLRPSPYDNYVLLAQAFLHGRAWIDYPGPYIDALRYGGQYYVIEAPMPAVLLLPAAAIFGGSTNQEVLAALLAGVACGATWELARRLGTPRLGRVVLCVFTALGTDLAWCATFGDVWFIAHVCAVAFTMLALLELAGARPRAWLVALFACCAVESRFTMVVALPFYALVLAGGWSFATARRDGASVERAVRSRALVAYAAVVAPFVLAWIGYNEARWGTPYDIGYTAWYHQDSAGQPDGSPFRLAYLPMQLSSFFVQAPERTSAWPYLKPGFGGVALTWTSPALLFAFLARGPWRTITLLWLMTLAAATPNFVYYVNGYAQFGMRHALDFEPFLVALMALAFRSRRVTLVAVPFVAYSAIVGAWGIWFWKAYYR